MTNIGTKADKTSSYGYQANIIAGRDVKQSPIELLTRKICCKTIYFEGRPVASNIYDVVFLQKWVTAEMGNFHKTLHYRYLTGSYIRYYPAGIYLFIINKRNTRTRCEIL